MTYKIGIVGAGFVGSACEVGFSQIQNCEVFVHDKYKPSHSLATVVDETDTLFLCLPTPMNEDGSCDLTIIQDVCEKIDKLATTPKTIVIKSTVLPGTTQALADTYLSHTFIFNPEFLTEANFIQDFLNQDRIILGYTRQGNSRYLYDLIKLYQNFSKTAKIYSVKSEEAEMSKYINNCFLATKVIFFNEMYEICKSSGIDYDKTVALSTLDKRIGSSHTKVPGDKGLLGYGGACFSKDINALTAYARDMGVDPLILESSWTKNLLVRQEYDWEKLAQVNGQYKKKT
jgi:UDPglucose 6-dehydrogenase